ncbi:MAG: hypothetical protein WC480_00335 [Patescibacteria group bacterium]
MEKMNIQNRHGQKVVVLVEEAQDQKGLALLCTVWADLKNDRWWLLLQKHPEITVTP